MKLLCKTFLALTAAAALAVSVSAQQPSSSNQQPNQGMPGMQGMQMNTGQKLSNNKMMQDCHKNMQTMMQSNDQATKEIEAAKQSNDPAKMRAALDTAEKALNGMNDHMKTCQSMMDMMQNMGGMMGGQQNQKKQPTPPKQ